MCSKHRELKYANVINEALHQMMSEDKSVFIMGQELKSPWYVDSTARGLMDIFGADRVIDTSVSENTIIGAAVGAAIAGMRSVVVHLHMDFMMYAMDPIVNQAANWHSMSGGESWVPLVIWAAIHRERKQVAQHSQAFHAIFTYIPGLKVVMLSNPYDAKGLLISAVGDNSPVVFVDDRWLYNESENVPEQVYRVPIGQANIRKKEKI